MLWELQSPERIGEDDEGVLVSHWPGPPTAAVEEFRDRTSLGRGGTCLASPVVAVFPLYSLIAGSVLRVSPADLFFLPQPTAALHALPYMLLVDKS